MEFFEFFSTAQYFLLFFGMYGIEAETAEEILGTLYRNYLIAAVIGAAVYLVLLVLGGIGLMKMAKRAGVKHSWMGFVPFLNTWYAGKLAGEANFFGLKMKRAGLYAAICEGLYSVLGAISVVSTFLFLQYSDIRSSVDTITGETVQSIEIIPSRIPQGLRWLYDLTQGETLGIVFNVASVILDFVLIVMLFVLFIAFFRKYYARGPVLMAFLCSILPFRGITLFAVRNNAPVDYSEFMRKRMEAIARQGQQQYGPQGPYGGSGSGERPPEDPFSDFGGSSAGGGAGNADSGTGNADSGTGGDPPPNDDPFSDF